MGVWRPGNAVCAKAVMNICDRLTILKKKRANASKKLDELEKSSASTWNSAKHGFAEAYKDLLDAYHEAAKKFN